MLPEGTLAEVIDGALYMSPSPFSNHQTVSMNLSAEIWQHLRKYKTGVVFTAPFDVYLDEERNAVQPDLIVVLKENESIIKGHIHGVPDMLVEILSPGNTKHDTVRKKALYERFGVKEYWIIDPESKTATGFSLIDNQYQNLGNFEGRIVSKLLSSEFRFVDESI